MEQYCSPCINHGFVVREKSSASISTLIIAACGYLGVDEAIICGKKRDRDIADVRHMIMSYLRLDRKFKYTHIGKVMCKDHTTVITAVKQVKNMCDTDAEFRHNYNELVIFLNDI